MALAISTSAIVLTPAIGWCAESGGEAAGGGSWLSLLFYIINFAVFVWILMRYAAPAARKFFADRAGGIRETFARAETTCREAQELVNRAGERMSQLDAEKQQLRADLDAETGYIANRIRELARETALQSHPRHRAYRRRDNRSRPSPRAREARRNHRESRARADGQELH